MTHVKQMESPRSREPLPAPKDTQLESPHNPVHVTPEPTFSLSAEKGRRRMPRELSEGRDSLGWGGLQRRSRRGGSEWRRNDGESVREDPVTPQS